MKRIFGFIIGVPVIMFLWSLASEMMTAKSDISVFAGVLIFALVISGLFWLGMKLISSKPEKGDTADGNNTIHKVLVVVLFFGIMSNGCAKVEPGYAGIKVNNYGDQRGVEDFPVQTGRVPYNIFTEDVYKFPTFLQNIVWTKNSDEGSPNDDSITFNSIEGAIVNADIALSYNFVLEKVPSIFIEFRKDPEHITNVYMRSKVRDFFSKRASTMKVVDIFGLRKQELLKEVKSDLIKELGPKGFNFDMVSFIGGLRVDEKVQASINAVISATQLAIQAENKIRQSEAEAKQLIATAEGQATSIKMIADGQAKANELISKSLTSQLIQWEATKRWNGIVPQVSSGAIPFISLPAGIK